jgi:hypothetical protein
MELAEQSDLKTFSTLATEVGRRAQGLVRALKRNSSGQRVPDPDPHRGTGVGVRLG